MILQGERQIIRKKSELNENFKLDNSLIIKKELSSEE